MRRGQPGTGRRSVGRRKDGAGLCESPRISPQIDWDGMSWARKAAGANESMGPPPKNADQIVARGDVVYVIADNAGNAQLGQVPDAQSALIAARPG